MSLLLQLYLKLVLESILEEKNCALARPYDNPDAFAEAISSLLDRPEKRELIRRLFR